MQPKQIKCTNKLSFSLDIGFGCMYNERFQTCRKSKLQPRKDRPFQILKRINDNAYKVDLSGKYGVDATFNVSDHTMFDVDNDSKSNPFKEKGDDKDQPNIMTKHANDPLELPYWPITEAKENKLKKTLNGLVQYSGTR